MTTEAQYLAIAMKRKALRQAHTHDPVAKARFVRWFRTVARLCALCGKAGRVDRADLHVDHNHKTGMVRGILCSRCNRALPFHWDDPGWRERALAYLASDLGFRVYHIDRKRPNVSSARKADANPSKFGCRHRDRCCHLVHK